MGQSIQTRFITVRTEQTIARVWPMVSIIPWSLCKKTVGIPGKPRRGLGYVARVRVALTFYWRWPFSRSIFTLTVQMPQ